MRWIRPGECLQPTGHSLRTWSSTEAITVRSWSKIFEEGAHEHPPLASPDQAQPGSGLLLFFRVDDFNEALVRARALVAELEEEPHLNPNTGTSEFALRDPDGYYVMVSALDAA